MNKFYDPNGATILPNYREKSTLTDVKNYTRFNPLTYADSGFIATEKFENTKNRYPWICSLRRRNKEKKHLCAVTLLRKPPGPTVMVTAAHCTFICKSQVWMVQE